MVATGLAFAALNLLDTGAKMTEMNPRDTDQRLRAIEARLVSTEGQARIAVFLLIRLIRQGVIMNDRLDQINTGMDALSGVMGNIGDEVHQVIVEIEQLKSAGSGVVTDVQLDGVLQKLAGVRDAANATKTALDSELAPPPPPAPPAATEGAGSTDATKTAP